MLIVPVPVTASIVADVTSVTVGGGGGGGVVTVSVVATGAERPLLLTAVTRRLTVGAQATVAWLRIRPELPPSGPVGGEIDTLSWQPPPRVLLPLLSGTHVPLPTLPSHSTLGVGVPVTKMLIVPVPVTASIVADVTLVTVGGGGGGGVLTSRKVLALASGGTPLVTVTTTMLPEQPALGAVKVSVAPPLLVVATPLHVPKLKAPLPTTLPLSAQR